MTVNVDAPSAASARQTGVAVDQVHVRYGVVDALDGVTLGLVPGQVHGLVGHNGSGKSTLARLLSGAESPSAGRIFWDGEPLAVGSGISVVHQSLGLADELTALENYGVTSSYDTSRWGWVSKRREAQEFEKHRTVLGVDAAPAVLVRELKPSQRAGLALMRSLRALDAENRASRFLILDEITSYLDSHEREQLAGTVASLAASNVGVVFISHYLDEVLAMCDVVTVLRSGRLVGTYECRTLDKSKLTMLMFGDTADAVNDAVNAAGPRDDPTAAAISLMPFLDATVRPGEILGITGRSGGEHEALPYDLARRLRHSGTVRIALVPSDRAARGAWLGGTIAENLTLSCVDQFRGAVRGSLSPKREREFATRWLQETTFRVSGPSARLDELSGGMQQKVVVGRALLGQPDLLILHDPTQGIDVSARAGILRSVVDAAQAGAAVVLVSREPADLIALADTVIVCREGSANVRMSGAAITEHALAAAL